MQAVAFQNQKGGVGKSTLSLLVAEQLAQIGREVIFLDNDPQGNSTQWFLNRLTDADYPLILEELQTKNLYNLLQERISPQNALLELPETSLKQHRILQDQLFANPWPILALLISTLGDPH